MPPRSSGPILSVRDLRAVFPDENGGLHALGGVTFDVRPQEFVCVLGPSGAGKSTLLRILAGLLPPTSGRVEFAGRGRPRIGFVFQQANLMPWRSALANVRLPLELEGVPVAEANRRAHQLLDLVGLKGFEHAWPRDLSGGMAQRVALARALIHDPDLLLLDEPFGSLDALTRERMGAELARLWETRRKTVIMVTHSIDEALFLADRVLVLTRRPGRVRLDLRVPLARPRPESIRYTGEFGRLARQLKEAIE